MLRRLSFVPRWVIMPTIRKQSVAEHSYGVTVIARALLSIHSEGHTDTFKLGVINSAIDHDKLEAQTGDTPSSDKPYEPPTANTDQTKVVVKCADYLEALMFLHEETLMGNSFGVEHVQNDLRVKLHDYWQLFSYCPHTGFIEGRKPLTSDLIRVFENVAFSTSMPHPSMFK